MAYLLEKIFNIRIEKLKEDNRIPAYPYELFVCCVQLCNNLIQDHYIDIKSGVNCLLTTGSA